MFAVAGGNSAATIVGAIGGLLTARFIDPETVGRFRSYTIPVMYLTFLHLGTFDGLSRQIPLLVGQGRRDMADAVASAAAWWNLLLAGVASGAFVLLAAWSLIRGKMEPAAGWAAQAASVWWVYYGGYLGATYRTLSNFAAFARVQVIQSVLGLLFVLALPLLGFFGLSLRAAIPAAVGTWRLHRARPFKTPPTWAPDPLLSLVRIGLPFCIWGSLYTSVWFALESTLLLALDGPRGLGLFAVAAVLRDGICIFPLAVSQVLQPRILEAFGRDGALAKASRSAVRMVPPLVLGMTLLAIAMSWALERLVPLLIPQYVDGVGLMKLALWFGVVQALALPLGGILYSGKGSTFGRGVWIGLLFFAATAYVLTPFVGGMKAVVAGSLAGKLVRTGVGYLDFRAMVGKEAA